MVSVRSSSARNRCHGGLRSPRELEDVGAVGWVCNCSVGASGDGLRNRLMTLKVTFVCVQCKKEYYDNQKWAASHEWDNLRDAIEHLTGFDDHDIIAETEINL